MRNENWNNGNNWGCELPLAFNYHILYPVQMDFSASSQKLHWSGGGRDGKQIWEKLEAWWEREYLDLLYVILFVISMADTILWPGSEKYVYFFSCT